MSEGFRKGKMPDRFEGKTDENLAVMQSMMWNCWETVHEEIEGGIVVHLKHYYDTEITAALIIKRIERLEKALDKACQKLYSFDLDTAFVGYWDAEAWKEWCMNDD